MKAFFLRHKKLHLWLLADLILIAAFHAAKHSRALMDGLTACVTAPVKNTLGAFCSLFPFSVAEVLIAAALGALTLYLVVFLADLVRRKNRRALTYRRSLGLLCALLSVYAAFCLLWGANYYTTPFQTRAGLSADPVSAQQLTAVTAYFADECNRLSGNVARDESKIFAVPREEIYGDAPAIWRDAEQEYPFLAMRDHKPKRVAFSKWMSQTNFTGFFFPLTGEANLNDHSPACLLPATIAHEMSHQRGVASEQACNFLAVLVCEKSGKTAYEYSGALFGFIHLSNALHKADPDAWAAIHEGLNVQVRADLLDNNRYWAQFESKAAEVSQEVYDSFLKSYGEESGIQSYGEVVDLLVNYYADEALK